LKMRTSSSQAEGAKREYAVLTQHFSGDGGKVAKLHCVHVDENFKPVAGTEFNLPVDMVVRAVGQKPATEFLRAVRGLELNKDGTVKIDERHQTGHPRYFAAGDCTNGGREVVDAVAEGMAAARGMDAWLGRPRAN